MGQHSPLDHYRQLLDSGRFTQDPDQLQAVAAFDALWHDLQRQLNPTLLDRLTRKNPGPVTGLYLWGSVGRGKTWLMDLFFDQLPLPRKQRFHFHRFMQRVHDGLRNLGKVRDPLHRIATDWAASSSVLCLDEFFVSDIADAMLLAGLLENLFANGVSLVATSNIRPERLYEGGLQRARFLPAIDLIEKNMNVVELAGATDYRLRILEQSELYHYPLDDGADRVMSASFERMAAECELNHDLDINGRNFHARRRGDGVIWFDFAELCDKPRGSADYIEIARAFNTVVLSGVPRMEDTDSDATRRFITLVDVFYDRNVKLLISAAVAIAELYGGRRLAFEFQRTFSRLSEMQSHEYLSRPHLP